MLKKVWRKIDDNFAPALSLKYERDQEITNKKKPVKNIKSQHFVLHQNQNGFSSTNIINNICRTFR